MAAGAPPTACTGGVVAQPAVCLALQRLASITDTVLSPALATYTVCVSRSRARADGPVPTGTVGGASPHPAVSSALQREISMTDTVLPNTFATYNVSVCGSSTIPTGTCPVGAVATTPRAQPDVRIALQVDASIT